MPNRKSKPLLNKRRCRVAQYQQALPPSWENHNAAYTWWDKRLSDLEEARHQKLKMVSRRLVQDQPQLATIFSVESQSWIVEGYKGNFKPLLKLLRRRVPDLVDDIEVFLHKPKAEGPGKYIRQKGIDHVQLAAEDALRIRSIALAQFVKKRWNRFEISPEQIAAQRHGAKEAHVRTRVKSMLNVQTKSRRSGR